jgi:hypothetical protein
MRTLAKREQADHIPRERFQRQAALLARRSVNARYDLEPSGQNHCCADKTFQGELMKTTFPKALFGCIALAGSVALVSGCGSAPGSAAAGMVAAERVVLTGASEVPPVATTAAGSGTVTIRPDHTVSVIIAVAGMTATAAHIHEGAAGANGPVIVPLTKTGDNTFAAPDGAKLTDSQYASYKAGNLYVNVHSAQYPGGEIRSQIKPN